jgi:ornithine carbamoyltransferase
LSKHYKSVYGKGSTAGVNALDAPKPLTGQTMSMIFQKRSTRTRVSTETGIALLGGHALFLGPSDIQLGVNESMRDTATVLSRFNSLILARVYGHDDILELAKYATVPVINALSDLHHPLQTLADLMALEEHFAGDLKGKTVSWVGDGNNVLHDLMLGSVKLGMHVSHVWMNVCVCQHVCVCVDNNQCLSHCFPFLLCFHSHSLSLTTTTTIGSNRHSRWL